MDHSRVFYWFEQLCAIPHGSGNTDAISAFVADAGRDMGLEVIRDDHNNVIITKPASSGRENEGSVMLQGHLDMVCEKETGLEIDMSREPITLVEDGDFLRAEGTTLGGDDGIAVAMALAILEDKTLSHPRLEAVFTDGEEIGMLGASAIDLSGLKSRTVLNMDSEDEGVFLTGCAGGCLARCKLPLEYEASSGIECTLAIDGLTGGHSGIEIDKNRGNACLLLGRFLGRLIDENAGVRLISLEGGSKDNAIPRSAMAKLLIPADFSTTLSSLLKKHHSIYREEICASDREFQFTAEMSGGEVSIQALTPYSTHRTVEALELLPCGIQAMNPLVPGMVETSLNLGIMRIEGSELSLYYLIRSGVDAEKRALMSKMSRIMTLIGGSVEFSGDYPAWEFNPYSPLRDLICAEYEALTGEKAVIQSIHAGVECGILGKKLKNADIVSYGPNIYNIHTPKERLSISSTKRVYELTVRVLEKLHPEK